MFDYWKQCTSSKGGREMKKGYALCLNEWLFDERIKNELKFLLYISSLSAEKGFCYASNQHIADKFKTTKETVSRAISKLEKLNIISISFQYGKNKQITQRRVLINPSMGIDENINRGIDENIKDNITSINNIKNTKKDFEWFIDFIKSHCNIKTKVTKGKGSVGFRLYCEIDDKRQLARDYVQHQKEKGEYSQTLANYMTDYKFYKSQNNNQIKVKSQSEDFLV